jgi:hypothetical protein
MVYTNYQDCFYELKLKNFLGWSVNTIQTLFLTRSRVSDRNGKPGAPG